MDENQVKRMALKNSVYNFSEDCDHDNSIWSPQMPQCRTDPIRQVSRDADIGETDLTLVSLPFEFGILGVESLQ